MMKYCYLLPGFLVFLVGCGKGDGPQPGDWVGNDPKIITIRTTQSQPKDTRPGQGAPIESIKKVIRPDRPLPKLAGLNVQLPAGWRSTYIEYANEWTFDKAEPKFLTRVRVARSPVETEPTNLNEYIRYIGKRPDEEGFIWPNVVESGNLPDGFYIVAQLRLATDITNRNLDTGFIVVRTINGDRIRFKCHKAKDDVTRIEALTMCKAARF